MDYQHNPAQPQQNDYKPSEVEGGQNNSALEEVGNAAQDVAEAAVNYAAETVHAAADVIRSWVTNLAKDAEEENGASMSGATNAVTDTVKGAADFGKATFKFAKDSGQAVTDSARSVSESMKADSQADRKNDDAYFYGVGM